jgi:hypothetical protein
VEGCAQHRRIEGPALQIQFLLRDADLYSFAVLDH